MLENAGDDFHQVSDESEGILEEKSKSETQVTQDEFIDDKEKDEREQQDAEQQVQQVVLDIQQQRERYQVLMKGNVQERETVPESEVWEAGNDDADEMSRDVTEEEILAETGEYLEETTTAFTRLESSFNEAMKMVEEMKQQNEQFKQELADHGSTGEAVDKNVQVENVVDINSGGNTAQEHSAPREEERDVEFFQYSEIIDRELKTLESELQKFTQEIKERQENDAATADQDAAKKDNTRMHEATPEMVETETRIDQVLLHENMIISEKDEGSTATPGSEDVSIGEETQNDDGEDDGQVSEDRKDTVNELTDADVEYEKKLVKKRELYEK